MKSRKEIKGKARRVWDHLTPSIVHMSLCMCIYLCNLISRPIDFQFYFFIESVIERGDSSTNSQKCKIHLKTVSTCTPLLIIWNVCLNYSLLQYQIFLSILIKLGLLPIVIVDPWPPFCDHSAIRGFAKLTMSNTFRETKLPIGVDGLWLLALLILSG